MENIYDYCKNLGSNKATPGGGSAAAITLSLASSCAEKASRFSLCDNISFFIDYFAKTREKGLILSEEDEKAFLGWKEARSLSENNEEEKKIKKDKIKYYTELCAKVPLNVAKECVSLLEVIEDFVPYCNKWLISDLAISISLTNASFESSIFNILINIPYLKNKDLIDELNLFIEDNEKHFSILKKNVMKSCRMRLKE